MPEDDRIILILGEDASDISIRNRSGAAQDCAAGDRCLRDGFRWILVYWILRDISEEVRIKENGQAKRKILEFFCDIFGAFWLNMGTESAIIK